MSLENNGETNRYPTRLDFGTKISLMAALMWEPNVELGHIVDTAIAMQEIVDRKVRHIKREHKEHSQR